MSKNDEQKPLQQHDVGRSAGMTEISIYKFQLETILEALRITSNIHESHKGETCHDRQVRQAYEYAKNALNNDKDKIVRYM